jgi:hypothetical protein
MRARGLAVTVVVLALSTSSLAEELTAGSIEHGAWADTVQALRERCDAGQHCVVHVQLSDGDGVVACAHYRLNPDDAARRAFSVGACDPASNATELTVADRHFFYSHAGGMAQLVTPLLYPSRWPPPAPVVAPTPPPADPSCWALVGPTLTDPETHAAKSVDPRRLMVSLAPGSPANAQTIAFDQGWLVRVPGQSVTQLQYALVPWHKQRSGKSTAVVLDVPEGVVRMPLALRCGVDPLGQVAPIPQVPQRLLVTDAEGRPVTLRRRQSDGALTAQLVLGKLFTILGPAASLEGSLLALYGGSVHSRLSQAGIGSVVGGGLLDLAGYLMAFNADRRQATRRWTSTVSVSASVTGMKVRF